MWKNQKITRHRQWALIRTQTVSLDENRSLLKEGEGEVSVLSTIGKCSHS